MRSLFRLLPAALMLGAAACAGPRTAGPADGRPMSFPLLPVRAALETPDSEGFCAGTRLQEALNWRAFTWVERSTASVWQRELRVTCSQVRPLVYSLQVTAWPSGEVLLRSKQRFDDETEAEHAARAFVFAHRLSRDKDVINAALDAHAANQYDVAELGATSWKEKRWEDAARELFMSLESDIAAPGRSALYFGLSQSFAGLGRPIQAFWYLRAFEAEGGDLDKADWAFFKGKADEVESSVMAWDEGESPRLETIRKELAILWETRRFHQGSLKLKALAAEAPWTAEYADLLSRTYRLIGWKRLAGHWKERAAFIRKLAKDREGSERLLKRLR
ncbi:MAG: hypothetical protein HY924_00025 [Elusimicrobia bacterium]|nr:hypothetical protein [Elusimicrobiota bacterium]